jgi:uncharacterized protein (DUF362 family)
MAVLLSDGGKNLKSAVCRILDTFLTENDYQRGIFIKPNIVFAVKPETGEITPPILVRTLITALRERHKNIDIVLGEGVAAGCDPQENFTVSGYAKLAHELNVPLLDLHAVERKTIAWKFGKLELPMVAFERTYINLPILKSSTACIISGALKNQKGLLQPKMKKHFHRLGLHEQIAELNAIIRPTLTIMDCSLFMGRNALISGNNCGEIDATACNLLGIDEPEHVRLSRNAGVYQSGYSLCGDTIALQHISDRPIAKDFKHMGRLRLWSNPQACTMCRYLFRDMQQDLLKPKNLSLKLKLLLYSIRGAEMIMGLNPKWQKDYDTVICIGACTRQIAKDGDYIFIPGCPPTTADFEKHIK